MLRMEHHLVRSGLRSNKRRNKRLPFRLPNQKESDASTALAQPFWELFFKKLIVETMEDHYTFCQVYIPGSAGLLPARAYYPIGLNGKYKAKVIGISFADQTNAKDNRLIRISSDSFRSIQGSYPQTIILCNRHEHNMGNPQGEFEFELDCVGGRIDLTIEASTAYTGGANDSFNFAILSMKVCPIKNS